MRANLQGTTTKASKVLGALLKELPTAELGSCTTTAPLHLSFSYQYIFARRVLTSGRGAPSLENFWQRVRDSPSALAATVEAISAYHLPSALQERTTTFIGDSLMMHIKAFSPGDPTRPCFPGWPALVGAKSLQQFSVEALETFSKQPSPFVQSEEEQLSASMPFSMLLSSAAVEGRLSETQYSALLTIDAILVPLRAMAEGLNRSPWSDIVSFASLLERSSSHFELHGSMPRARHEAHGAAQRAVMAVVRQGTALLQLRAAAPAQRQRAVRRARRGGFLKVITLSTGSCCRLKILNEVLKERHTKWLIPCSYA